MIPLASVIILAYNQNAYISECIDGAVSQDTTFPIEIILADDCSTDGTREICEEYAAKCPELIKLLPSDRNVGAVANEQRAFLAAKGKYIATCEGDDLWTDSLKLQKQVDFLEANPGYSVCFHRYKKMHTEDGIEEGDGCDKLFANPNESSIKISMHQFMHQWCTQYLSMVFRKDCYDFEAYKRYKYYRDTHQIYHLIKNGKCRLFSFYGGVYRMTGSGSYTTMNAFHRAQMTLDVDKELWKVNKDKRWKEMCTIVMQDIIDNFATQKENKNILAKYAINIFFAKGNSRKFVKNLVLILK